MTLNELLNRLDYDKLRFDYEFLMKLRVKDSPATRAKFVIGFTKYDSELGKEIRDRKKVQTAFVKEWAKGLSTKEMRAILKNNIEVSPSHTLSILSTIMDGGSDRSLILEYMKNNNIRRIRAMSIAEVASLVPLAVSSYYVIAGAVNFEFWQFLVAMLGVAVSSLPHALRQRNISSGFLSCIEDYIKRTGEEPGLLFCHDKRAVDYG